MKYKMFQRQFAPSICGGIKTTTIRPKSKRLPSIGELISARYWEDRAYSSKQVKFAFLRIISISEVQIMPNRVVIDGKKLTKDELTALIDAEGFASAEAFWDFFSQYKISVYKPFFGHLFRFELDDIPL